ncbi:MAG: DegT/DnrJ/EryC1/StrS family aminotransferase [Treponema sp.]|jgi:dTDP-4-amino-4,6-dideoxygalactose transaminase|nr:DegT/DnrJ/EryC1/StrS family aminotransferase [Treponema sp.]
MKIEAYSPTIRRKEMDAVLTAMVQDKIGPGGEAKVLIQTAKEKLKFDFCLSLRSPAIALTLALKALGLERGQGILVSALSPLYYDFVIKDLGFVPIYCDVPSASACVSLETVEKAIAGKPQTLDVRGIVLHHTLGYLSDAQAIAELGIPVIEDCSHSYGTYSQKGSSDVAAAASPQSAGGEEPNPSFSGGIVSSGDSGVFTILGLEERDMLTSGGGALLYATSRRNASVLRGFEDMPPEYGLPDMNAALAVVQFREAAKNLAKRREIASLYAQASAMTRHKRFVNADVEYNNYAFPLILETGVKDVKAYAKKKEMAVENAFDNTLIGSGAISPEQCPEAYSLSLRTVLFPLYPRLKMTDAEKISKLILTLP